MTTQAVSGRVLVVDDQPDNLRMLASLLARAGHEVATAANAEDGLALASAHPPDLVLLDMKMPHMDGFAMLDELQRDPDLRALPVMFLAAARDRGLLLQAFAAGAVDSVTKPFIPEELLARVRTQVGLKLTRDRLERVARERQELVNLVAHDLKNPLTSVRFASDMLLQGACTPDRVPRYLDIIRDSADDALGYIHRYLETQAGLATPTTGTASLAEAFAWFAQRYALLFEDRDMALQVTAPPATAEVAIDPLLLRRIGENLLGNALKYAPGGEVSLSARRGAEGYWQLLVEDRGPGIEPARRRELFRPFTRLMEGDPANGLSSGLGLALARQALDQHGGALWYEDREGGGARFVVELPEAGG